MWHGETTGRMFYVATSECFALPSFASVEQMYTVPANGRSFIGAVSGNHYDPLIPRAQLCGPGWYWIDFKTPAESTVVRIGSLTIIVNVLDKTLPAKPAVPFYTALQVDGIRNSHKITTWQISAYAPLVQDYVNLLRAHGIEPFNQYIGPLKAQADGFLNLDEYGNEGGSYRQLQMNGALAPNFLFMFSSQSQATLQAAEKSIAKEPALTGAMHYVIDEPSDAAPTNSLTIMRDRLAADKLYAPSMKRMVTTMQATADIDFNVAAFEQYKAGQMPTNFWLYGSCMSHGSCGNDLIGARTGTPDLMVEEPTIYYRLFPLVAARLGAKAILYYTAMEAQLRGLDPWINQYMQGGWGEGTLVYPCRAGEHGVTKDMACGSIRLKMLREGNNDKAKMLANPLLPTLIQDAKNWSKRHSDYDALR
jgi:hypothetical protein